MDEKEAFKCVNCGSNSYHHIDAKTVECDYCHTKYRVKTKSPSAKIKAGDFEAGVDFGDIGSKVKTYVEEKPVGIAKIIYAVVAILFGVFGIEELLAGKKGLFIISLIFFWTGIPAIIGLVKGIMALLTDDYGFMTMLKKNSYLYRYINNRKPVENDTIKNS